ncbi:MAG: Uma2 family endonuclease [Gemmataceae bacterium]
MVARRTAEVVYPDSDGKPMADNTLQWQWMHTIESNLERLYADRDDVFVAGDNLWYPVEGEPEVRQAPDVYVVFGRPKGHRGSYQQWNEGGLPLTVVFEILSPGNTKMEMDEKFRFYDEHGVEEYYLYDPQKEKLTVYQRGRAALRKIRFGQEFVSPRLGIRFDLTDGELVIYHPDGGRFLTNLEDYAERRALKRQADDEKKRADRLAEKLRALGLDPEA